MDGITLLPTGDELQPADLEPFFVGWPMPPSPAERLEILRAADEVVVARAGDEVVGFATALTDGRFAAYLPLVEVVPDRQGEGIGSVMVHHLLDRLDRCYMVDLACDDDVVPFYERLGGTRLAGVGWRRPERLTDGA